MAAVSYGPGAVAAVNKLSKTAHLTNDNLDARELQRQRELDEARGRAAQMVKTMKWWSECTANWREKWIKFFQVRNERNKAREDIKQLRLNLEAASKETHSYKREKQELEMQISQLKQEMEQVHALMMKHAGQFDRADMSEATAADEVLGHDSHCANDNSCDGLKNVNSEDGLVTKVLCKDLGKLKLHVESTDMAAEEKRLIQQLSKDDDFDEQFLLQKISKLEICLDEAQQTIQAEQSDKSLLQKNVEKLCKEGQVLRERQEQLYAAKQDAVRELLTMQELHRAEISIVNKALQEEMSTRESFERRQVELRQEYERLQTTHAAECDRRERLETEKLALERRNKMLSTEVRYYQELFDHKGLPTVKKCDRCGNARPSSGGF